MISKQMLTEFGLIYTEAAETHMRNYLAYIYNFRDKYFGNARTVRNIVTEMIKRQNLRLANLTTTKRKKVDANEIEFVDVEVFKLDKTDFIFNKRTIGFGK
jgi:hypothetical protein